MSRMPLKSRMPLMSGRFAVSPARRRTGIALLAAGLFGCSEMAGDLAMEPPQFPTATLAIATSTSGWRIEIRSAPTQPPPRGPCWLEARVTDTAGQPLEGLTVHAVPWMPSMGHGVSAEPAVQPQGQGRYLIGPVRFVMPGDWVVRLQFEGTGGEERADAALYVP